MALKLFRDAVRNDPLGPSRLNGHLESLRWLRAMYQKQHIVSTSSPAVKGEHNAWEVPRVSRRIVFGGGTATLSNSSTDITAVANPATGTLTLTLAASRFTTAMRLQVTASASDGSKPRIATYRVVSATSVEVYLKELSSALGAGNAWAAVNGTVDVAIHDAPLTQTTWPDGPNGSAWPRGTIRGNYLVRDEVAETSPASGFWWNDYILHHATLRDAYLVEHTTAGEHDSINIARRVLWHRWKSAATFQTYLEEGDTFTLTDVGTGIVQLDYTAVTAATSLYVCPDWTRDSAATTPQGTPVVINPLVNSTSRTTLYSFVQDVAANTWARGYVDSYLVIHSAA